MRPLLQGVSVGRPKVRVDAWPPGSAPGALPHPRFPTHPPERLTSLFRNDPHSEVTIIPDDHTTGTSTVEDVRRWAAAAQGAVEGFVEALERFELAEEAKQAAHEAGDITRAAVVEGRAQGQTPEMQQLGRGLHSAAAKTSDLTHRATDSIKGSAAGARDGVSAKAGDMKANVAGHVDDVRAQLAEAKHQIDDAVESMKFAAARVKAETKVRAEAVAESGRRAKVAPSRIGHELSGAVGAWWRGIMTSMGMWAAIGVLGIITLIVLTIALVVGLNALFGDPLGTFAVVVLYLIVMGIAYAYARSAKARAQDEVEEHVERSKEEARHVARPVREAFSRGRSGI